MTAFGIYGRKCGHFGINYGDGFHFIRIKKMKNPGGVIFRGFFDLEGCV
jgi:hypothetical protein